MFQIYDKGALYVGCLDTYINIVNLCKGTVEYAILNKIFVTEGLSTFTYQTLHMNTDLIYVLSKNKQYRLRTCYGKKNCHLVLVDNFQTLNNLAHLDYILRFLGSKGMRIYFHHFPSFYLCKKLMDKGYYLYNDIEECSVSSVALVIDTPEWKYQIIPTVSAYYYFIVQHGFDMYVFWVYEDFLIDIFYQFEWLKKLVNVNITLPEEQKKVSYVKNYLKPIILKAEDELYQDIETYQHILQKILAQSDMDENVDNSIYLQFTFKPLFEKRFIDNLVNNYNKWLCKNKRIRTVKLIELFLNLYLETNIDSVANTAKNNTATQANGKTSTVAQMEPQAKYTVLDRKKQMLNILPLFTDNKLNSNNLSVDNNTKVHNQRHQNVKLIFEYLGKWNDIKGMWMS